jgi:sugar lactone lactonase YvrE
MRKLILIVLIFIALYLILRSVSRIDSVGYNPPPIPELKGVFEPNKRLLNAEKMVLSKGTGAEDVEVDNEGNIYTGLENGLIVKVSFNKSEEVIANTGGRPFGLRFGGDGNLYVADGIKGLLKIDFKNNYKIEVLTNEADGIPFRFTDHLDVASDGKIYFTDASSKYGPGEYLYDLLESRPYGRFLVYDPKTKKTTTLMKDLYFSNGVALSKDESFVLVNETYRYRIWRYWLKGKKKDTYEVFYENLPGFPDNLRTSPEGDFWLCLFTKRNKMMDLIHPYPSFKNILSTLPKFLWPKPAKYGFIVKLDSNGNVIETLQNPDTEEPKFVIITGVKEHNNYLYFASLYGNWIGRLKLQ